ncbi:MAG: LolA family protein [Saprospiraceae bacterium]
MKSRIFVIIIFTFFVGKVYNAPTINLNDNNPKTTNGQKELSDAQAIKVLSKVYKSYASYSSLKMNIDITIKDGDFSYKKSGKASVKGEQYKLETRDESIISNGKTLWIYLKGDNSLQITNATANDQNLFCYPALLLQKYQKYCVVEFLRSEGNDYVLQFTSYNENCPYQKITVNINKSNYTISKIEASETSETSYLINVKNIEKNKTINQTAFSFDEKKVAQSKIQDFRF